MPEPKRGRWKNNKARVKTFIKRALQNTQVSMRQIAIRSKVPYSKITWQNLLYDIRSPEESKKIGFASQVKIKSKKRRKPKNPLTRKEKEEAINNYVQGPYFNKQVRIFFYKNRYVFGKAGISIDDLTQQVIVKIFGFLDLYDKDVNPRRGITAFIFNGVNFALRSARQSAKKRQQNRQAVSREGVSLVENVAETNLPNSDALITPQGINPRKWNLLRGIKRVRGVGFWKNFGANPYALIQADQGELVTAMIETGRKAGLNARQQRILELRLEGKKLEECGRQLGISKERARQIQTKIITKLKSFLRLPT